MKIIFIYLLITIVTTIISIVLGEGEGVVIGCSGDWECGNPPFSSCKRNKTVVLDDTRIDVDRINSRVYFTVQYPGEIQLRVISIPTTGIASNGKGAISHITLYGQSIYEKFYGLNQLVGPISNRIVANRGIRITGNGALLFNSNNTRGNVLSGFVAGNYIFDELNNIQYSCSSYIYGVRKSKIGESDGMSESIYEGSCLEMRNVGNQLFIQDHSGTIRVGSLIGKNSNELPIVYTDSKMALFEISSTHIYYTHNVDKKLYKVPLNSNRNSIIGGKTLVLNEFPSSFKFHNDFIYYQIGSKIARVSTLTANSIPQTLFESSSSTAPGHCICEQGFSGTNCEICTQPNNIISWVNGKPRCIPINSNNNPISCDYDYQCKPYGNSTCKELSFSGGNKACSGSY